MRRSNRVWLGAALLAFLVLVLCTSTAAYADDAVIPWIGPDLGAASRTNPDNGAIDSYYRLAWGSSVYPNIAFGGAPSFVVTVSTPGTLPAEYNFGAVGLTYRFDRTPARPIADLYEGQPGVYVSSIASPAAPPDGTLFSKTIDLMGIYGSPPAGSTYDQSGKGQTYPWEGDWYMHVLYFCTNPFTEDLIYEDEPTVYRFGIDQTPPRAVDAAVFAANSSPPLQISDSAPVWVGQDRRQLAWTNNQMDALSGIGLYQVTIQGRGGARTALYPSRDGIPYRSAVPITYPVVESLTIEDMPPGKASVTVVALDRAGNRAAPVTLYSWTDTDTPAISGDRPSAGGKAGPTTTFSAVVTDNVGVTSVNFKLDGRTIYSGTRPSYRVTRSLATMAHGSTHTFTITAKDAAGHVGTKTNTFKIDKARPRLTMYGDSPDPFYPNLQDGYKDRSNIKFRVYERCTVTLQVFKSNGSLWRQSRSTKSAGLRSMTWDGKGKGGAVQTGTFYYRIGATDVAGNTTWSAKYPTHIRNYELKQTADGGIRVIPR